MSNDIRSSSDKELFELIEKAAIADKLKTDPAWKLLREASDRIVERAIAEFAIKTEPDNYIRIIQLQTIIKKYKYGLLEEIEQLASESDVAFEVAEERGIFGELLSSLGFGK